MRRTLPFLPFLLLAACAAAQATDPTLTAAYSAACGSPDEPWKVSLDAAAPLPASTNFVLLQDENISASHCLAGHHSNCGALLRFGVDGHWVGATKGLSYLPLELPAGTHHLCVAWQSHLKVLSHHALSLNVAQIVPGQTSYWTVRVLDVATTEAGGGGFALQLVPLNDDEARLLIESSPRSVATRDK